MATERIDDKTGGSPHVPENQQDHVRNPLVGLNDPKVRSCFFNLLCFYGQKFDNPIPPEYFQVVIGTLSENTHLPPREAAQAAYDRVGIPLKGSDHPVAKAYFTDRYRNEVRPDLMAEQIAPYLTGYTINAGGGTDKIFPKMLKNKNPKITNVVTTDIRVPFNVQSDSYGISEWKQRTSTEILPAEDNGKPASIVFYHVLHHAEDILGLVQNAYYLLSPGGNLVVMEDTWSEKNIPYSGETSDTAELNKQFMKLSSSQKHQLMALHDWYGNHFVHNLWEMPLSANYRTLEDWDIFFTGIGFKIVEKINLGFVDKPFSHRPPQGLIVLEKPSYIS